YRLDVPAVSRIRIELRTVAEQQLAEMDRALVAYRTQRHAFTQISADALHEHIEAGGVILLDVRPRQEYEASHLSGARSIPLDELPTRLDELPADLLIVTYCRGPLCVYADQALELITASGRRGARLEEGVAEWRLAGYQLDSSESTTDRNSCSWNEADRALQRPVYRGSTGGSAPNSAWSARQLAAVHAARHHQRLRRWDGGARASSRAAARGT